MPNLLPPLNQLVMPDEFEMTLDEEVRLLDDRPRMTRWWWAPYGTPDPSMRAGGGAFLDPWGPPWAAINDPLTDALQAVLLVDRRNLSGSRGALLILVHPTAEAQQVWEAAAEARCPVSLGAERVQGGPYRAIVPYAWAHPPVPGTPHLRFSVGPTLTGRGTWEAYVPAEGPTLCES